MANHMNGFISSVEWQCLSDCRSLSIVFHSCTSSPAFASVILRQYAPASRTSARLYARTSPRLLNGASCCCIPVLFLLSHPSGSWGLQSFSHPVWIRTSPVERYGPSPVDDWYEELHDAHCDAFCDASQCLCLSQYGCFPHNEKVGTLFPLILATALAYTMTLTPNAPVLAFSFVVSYRDR